MRAVLAPVGTRGDVQPIVALGRRMQDTGHDVTLCVAENFRALVEGAGLRYARGGRDVESIVRGHGEKAASPLTYPFALFDVTRTLVDEQFESLAPLCEGADVLVGSLLLLAGPSMGERFGVPVCMTSYFPGGLPTDTIPSPFLSRATAPLWLTRASWSLQSLLMNAGLRGPLNQHRARMGLAPVGDLQQHVVEGSQGMLATDPEIGPVPPEWEGRVDVTGFWHLDSAAPLPDDLEAFLAAGDRPVYVGFGSMPNVDPVMQTEVVAEACRTVGCRAIVSAGWAGLGGVTSAALKSIGPVNHGALFARVAAVVHHGGAGTLAAAARAGVPQVVVPHLFDQFYWAARVHALGLGPAPLPRDFRAPALVSALRTALEDDAMTARAAVVGARLRADRGTDRAIAVLERVVADGT